MNATKAAIKAGYTKKNASSMGCQVLSNPKVKSAINERFEKMAMSAEEATVRLGVMARGTLEPFVRHDAEGNPRLVIPEGDSDSLALLKRIKVKEHRTVDDTGAEHITTTTEFEIHDPKDAIDKILKVAGAYRETIDHRSSDGSMTPPSRIEIVAGKP